MIFRSPVITCPDGLYLPYPATCVGGHCFPCNGSCVWGCNPDNCLNNICDTATGKCTLGCKIGLHGDYCDKGKFTNRY